MQEQQCRASGRPWSGRVVSDKMDKTIVVFRRRKTRHPLYKAGSSVWMKFKAHDEANRGPHRRHSPDRRVAAASATKRCAS